VLNSVFPLSRVALRRPDRLSALNCLVLKKSNGLSKNVTIKRLIRERFAPHIVCPPMAFRYYLLSSEIHNLLAGLLTKIHR